MQLVKESRAKKVALACQRIGASLLPEQTRLVILNLPHKVRYPSGNFKACNSDKPWEQQMEEVQALACNRRRHPVLIRLWKRVSLLMIELSANSAVGVSTKLLQSVTYPSVKRNTKKI